MPEREADAIMEAMLQACGELGYGKVGIEDVMDRCGGCGGQFSDHFPGLAECFDAAYAVEADRLAGRILKRGADEGSWQRGLGAALRELAAYAQERPAVLRALLLTVHIAGERTRNQRTEILERLARAVDSARRQTQARHSPPPLTGLFMVSAIEAAAIAALVKDEPESFLEMVPELERLVFNAYFGD